MDPYYTAVSNQSRTMYAHNIPQRDVEDLLAQAHLRIDHHILNVPLCLTIDIMHRMLVDYMRQRGLFEKASPHKVC